MNKNIISDFLCNLFDSLSNFLKQKKDDADNQVESKLDGLSELLARLESLEAFADLCESRNLKSSKEILPDENTPSGLYLLPAN